jgi:hypothetical protein
MQPENPLIVHRYTNGFDTIASSDITRKKFSDFIWQKEERTKLSIDKRKARLKQTTS